MLRAERLTLHSVSRLPLLDGYDALIGAKYTFLLMLLVGTKELYLPVLRGPPLLGFINVSHSRHQSLSLTVRVCGFYSRRSTRCTKQ
jgi:hypothetical protein